MMTTHLAPGGQNPAPIPASRWCAVEWSFLARRPARNPYTDVDFWAVFRNELGDEHLRPGFWCGAREWRLRFAPPARGRQWSFETFCSDPSDIGLHGLRGRLAVETSPGGGPFQRHGYLRVSPGGRNFEHADGTPFLLIADTPWSLPFRGTPESVALYARTRAAQGFNVALLMSVQSDQQATGPRNRHDAGGFDVGFEDLAQGHLNELNPDYFQKLDTLIEILLGHGIVPAYNPVFQGYGWKGGRTLGNVAAPAEYVRYQRYLIARYGAHPAIWLVSADGTGRDAMVAAAGEACEEWDLYRHPTGIHFNPYDDRQPPWTNDPYHGFHHNRVHQSSPWLDFLLAQTGHEGLHLPGKVARMHGNRPVRAVANGEPTYERIAAPDRAAGWWQGHEAWLNLTAGGTLGHVYGAGGLWNWKFTADEPGWQPWCDAAASWRDALAFDGARYVGYLQRALAGCLFSDMTLHPDLADGQPLLAVPGRFYLAYRPEGGSIRITGVPPGLRWHWFNPRTGHADCAGTTAADSAEFVAPTPEPWVLVVGAGQPPPEPTPR